MSRHGKLAPGKTRMTVVMTESMKDELKLLAERENRSVGNWIETRLQALVDKAKSAEDIKRTKRKKAMVPLLKTTEQAERKRASL